MKNLIDKYIERIKIDFPEDDKLMIDLQDFAKEIQNKQSILSEVIQQSEQLCQYHKWVKYTMHPKIGAMICEKCGTILA